MRLAICTNFVSPYRRPVFAALAEQTGADVRVFTSTRMERDREWAVIDSGDTSFSITRSACLTRRITSSTPGEAGFTQHLERHFPFGLPTDLIRFRPDAIISGELGPRTMLALVAGRTLNVPVVPWTYHSEAQSEPAGRSDRLREAILRNAPAVIGMGTQARRVLKARGATDDQIFDAPNAADRESIQTRLESPEHIPAVDRIRARFQGRRVALVVGRLVPMKGIEELLAVWTQIDPGVREQWALVFVGNGPLRSIIEQESALGVHAVGHVDPEHMPDWYAASDLHVFASLGDPWGLVVNESMQCGTPTLCSVRAGCSDDLIIRGRTGLHFDPAAPTPRVVRAIEEALCRDDLADIGRSAAEHIRSYGPEDMAAGMAMAIEHAIRRRSAGSRKARA